MGYYVYDVNGYVADGPSLTGWRHLRDRVLLPQGGPVTRAFVEQGTTEQVAALAAELATIAAPDGPMAVSLTGLQTAVGRCSDVVILTQVGAEVTTASARRRERRSD